MSQGTYDVINGGLEGKTILVCGVLRGAISGALVRRIAVEGANALAVDHAQAIVDQTVADIEAAGGTCHGIVADLTDPQQGGTIVGPVIRCFGRLDGVANVAGGDLDKLMPLEDTPDSVFSDTFSLHLDYVFRRCRDTAVWMIKNGSSGSLVNIGSVSAANLNSGNVDGGEALAWTSVDELANSIAFLLSDSASGVSGQNLVVDSGLSMKFCCNPAFFVAKKEKPLL